MTTTSLHGCSDARWALYTYRVFCSWLIRLFITSILVQSLELTQGMAGQLGVGLDNFAQYTLSGTTQGKIRNISKYWSFLWQILIVSVAEVISFIFFKSEAKFFINLNIGSDRYAPNTLFWFCRISCPFDNRISGLLQPGIRPHTGYKKKIIWLDIWTARYPMHPWFSDVTLLRAHDFGSIYLRTGPARSIVRSTSMRLTPPCCWAALRRFRAGSQLSSWSPTA